MAKIFRKFRQKFLEERKLESYLLYAIGEILLVVIGILIALQINSMNQDRQRAELEQVLLEQIRFEMLEIYEDLWRDAANLELGDRSHHNISDYIRRDLPYTDSLCFDFHWLKVDEYIYPTTAAYSRLQEEGLDIIQNDSISLIIQSLYEGHFPRLTVAHSSIPNISLAFNDYYLNSFRPNSDYELEFYFELANDTVGRRHYTDVSYAYPKPDTRVEVEKTIGYVPLNFESLKEDPKFQMLLEQTKGYRDNKIRRYAYVRSIIKLLIPILERELEKVEE